MKTSWDASGLINAALTVKGAVETTDGTDDTDGKELASHQVLTGWVRQFHDASQLQAFVSVISVVKSNCQFWDQQPRFGAPEPGERTIRTYTLAEFFGILTGRGIRWEQAGQAYELKLTDQQAVSWLQTNTADFIFLDLPAAEVLAALAQPHNVAGPRAHDYLHAVAVQKSGAAELVTRNATNFASLTGTVKVIRP